MLKTTSPTTEALGVTASAKQDAKYDIAKFVLSLLVVAIHASLYPTVLFPWLRIAVPLFFMISSYFLFSKMREASADQHKSILKKFVVRNLQLYLCWFVILLPITLYIRKDIYFSHGWLQNVVTMLKSVLFGSTFAASWFLTAMVIGVLIVYLLNKVLKNNLLLLLVGLMFFTIVTLGSSYYDAVADTFFGTIIKVHITVFGALVCSFPAAVFWVVIGKLFAEQKIKMHSWLLWVVLMIGSAVALFVEWKYAVVRNGSYSMDSYFMLAPLCVLLFLGLTKIRPIYRERSVYVRRLSTVVYVVHASLMPIISKLISVVFHVKIPLLSFLMALVACVAVYMCLEFAVKKTQTKRINKIFKMMY